MSENSIVIYYSQSGVTRMIAKKIQKIIDSEIFEITSDRRYNSDMWKAYEEAKVEIETDNMPTICGELPDLRKYKKVYVGSPVWGGAPANPMKTFLRKIDFHGANVIPFWTFYDYEGNYEQDIIKECRNANPQSGFGITNQLIHSGKLDEELMKMII